MEAVPDIYLCSTGFPVGDLKAEKCASNLTDKELQYAANWILSQSAGIQIIFDQISASAKNIHEFLSAFYMETPKDKLRSAPENSPIFYLNEYAATFYNNSGDYNGFGDQKFVPRCTKDELREIVKGNKKHEELLEKCIDEMYDYKGSKGILGFHPDGCTRYYLPDDFSMEEAEGIDKILLEKGIRNENTRIIRHDDKYEVSIASIEVDEKGQEIGEYKGKKVVVTKGRYSEVFKKVVEHLKKAEKYAANETQEKMIQSLIEHYTTGKVESHIKYSEYWVRDVDPVVETYQGFVECYRDPKGCRCEFEGFVSCVDKEESVILHNFVDESDKVLSLLPYPKQYERTTFTPPSYNALNILVMNASGFPIGINIPNYDEIRLNIGFKNVSLTNVMTSVKTPKTVAELLHPSMRDVFMEFSEKIESLATSAHELFGHGSVRLLKKEDVEGDKVPDLLTPGKFVKTYWPDDGKSYDATFGTISSAFEECRAETTAVYLTFFDEVLDIFKCPADKEYRRNFLFVTVVSMLLSGLRSMWCYSAEARKWTQAHSEARFAILRACLMWGRGAATVKKLENGNVELFVDINNLDGIRDAITTLLKHLTYYKATCLPGPAAEFFGALTSINDHWLSIKKIIDKIPRKRPVYSCGVVRETEDGKFKIESVTNEEPNAYDVALAYIETIHLASK